MEEIMAFLREAEVRLAQGETAGKICRGAGIAEQICYKCSTCRVMAHNVASLCIHVRFTPVAN
jgi:hypothetical protein